ELLALGRVLDRPRAGPHVRLDRRAEVANRDVRADGDDGEQSDGRDPQSEELLVRHGSPGLLRPGRGCGTHVLSPVRWLPSASMAGAAPLCARTASHWTP